MSELTSPRSPPTMSWTCGFCKRSLPATTEGTSKKKTVRVQPEWSPVPLTVIDGGEQCYPCPQCEEKDEIRAITHWDHADIRLHKRLRQHHARAHQQKLHDKYSSAAVVQFYEDARRLRCELIHGPDDASHTQRETPVPKTPPNEQEPAHDPETPTRRRARNVSAKESQAISLPPSYLEWLRDELRRDSVASYTGIAKTFLHWHGKTREEPAVLADVWNLDSVRAFIADLKPQVAPTTIFNYVCALQTAQRFVRERGEIEPTPGTVFGFAALFRQASRGKSEHQKVVAETKRKTSVMLHEVKERILDNDEIYRRFKGLVKLASDGGSLSQSQFTWATGYALFNLQASNFKRNGNTLKIPFKPALKRIQAALKHKKACELVVTNATKTGGTEVFSIVKMQRLKILLMYAVSLRPSAMGSGQCPQFFVNSVGNRITKASPYISALGKSVGLPNLTIKDLRSRIETEAALKGKTVDRSAIADHLAHTEATRDRHYLLVDKRRSREAAMDVEKLIDQAEPPEDSDADTSLDSSLLSEDDIEYDDDTSEDGDTPSPEENDTSGGSTSSNSEPESDHPDTIHSEEGTTSDESKKEEFIDLTFSSSPSPSPPSSKKRDREPTGLSESESSESSLMPATPLTKKARLEAKNSEAIPTSTLEFPALHGSPPLRTSEVCTATPSSSLSLSEEKESPTTVPPTVARAPVILILSDDSRSPRPETKTVPDSEGDKITPESSEKTAAATERAHITSNSPGSTKSSLDTAAHQRPRASSENGATEPRPDSEDEGAKSDPGEASPPWTRTLRRRVYTVPKQ